MKYKSMQRSDQRKRINKLFIQRYVHTLVIHSYNIYDNVNISDYTGCSVSGGVVG